MDLMSSLNASLWQAVPAADVQGLKAFAVVRSKILQPGKLEVAIRENADDAEVKMVHLEGLQGKTNPLATVRNIEMKVDGTNIVAMNLDDDCVARK